MKRPHHENHHMVVNQVQGILRYKLHGEKEHLKEGEDQCTHVDHNPSIWRWHGIVMFFLILDGRKRGVGGCVAQPKGMWSGQT